MAVQPVNRNQPGSSVGKTGQAPDQSAEAFQKAAAKTPADGGKDGKPAPSSKVATFVPRNPSQAPSNRGPEVTDRYFDAIKKGDTKAVAAMIKDHPAGFDVNATNADGRTALEAAVFANNNTEVVKALVNDGRIDMAKLGKDGLSGLQYLQKNADRTLGVPLKDVDQFLSDKMNGELKQAVHDGNQARAEALVKAGADPKAAPPPPSEPKPDVPGSDPNGEGLTSDGDKAGSPMGAMGAMGAAFGPHDDVGHLFMQAVKNGDTPFVQNLLKTPALCRKRTKASPFPVSIDVDSMVF